MAATPSGAPKLTPTPEKQALADALQNVYRTDAERAKAEVEARRAAKRLARRKPMVMYTALVLLLSTGAYLGLAQPAWLWPQGRPVESRGMQEASLRVAMYMTAQRVERYRTGRGRLPDRLEDVGPAPDGLEYIKRPPQAWTLRGRNGPVALTLQSSDSLRGFLGTSLDSVLHRSAQ